MRLKKIISRDERARNHVQRLPRFRSKEQKTHCQRTLTKKPRKLEEAEAGVQESK